MPTEHTIQQQEQQIPQLAMIALKEAGQSALAGGYHVLEFVQDSLLAQTVNQTVTNTLNVTQQMQAYVAVERGQVLRRTK